MDAAAQVNKGIDGVLAAVPFQFGQKGEPKREELPKLAVAALADRIE
ncbi:MAG: hypothetical protein LBJ11_01450 [Oscillospiraceae bacterium]|jgi:hypothetical protein|nr:hypothetical protein [Oscillospiraceae bacterium]